MRPSRLTGGRWMLPGSATVRLASLSSTLLAAGSRARTASATPAAAVPRLRLRGRFAGRHRIPVCWCSFFRLPRRCRPFRRFRFVSRLPGPLRAAEGPPGGFAEFLVFAGFAPNLGSSRLGRLAGDAGQALDGAQPRALRQFAVGHHGGERSDVSMGDAEGSATG